MFTVRAIELEKEQVDQSPQKDAVIIIGRLEAFRRESEVEVLSTEQCQSQSCEYENYISRDGHANNPVRGHGDMGATGPRRRGRLAG